MKNQVQTLHDMETWQWDLDSSVLQENYFMFEITVEDQFD